MYCVCIATRLYTGMWLLPNQLYKGSQQTSLLVGRNGGYQPRYEAKPPTSVRCEVNHTLRSNIADRLYINYQLDALIITYS